MTTPKKSKTEPKPSDNYDEELDKRFHQLVSDTRDAQRTYFAERTPSNLKASKALEDKLLRSIEWVRNNKAHIRRDIVLSSELMIQAQQKYFRKRDKKNMINAKQVESRVDKLIKKYFDTQTDLFENQ